MKRCTPAARLLPLLAAVALTSGCSVMRIDVDVYKGPLANEADIQTEQLAAMAIGAKPLLIQLRDILEKPDSEKRGELRDELWYQADYIAPPAPGLPRRLENEQARRVNAVLSLYIDTDESGLGRFASPAMAAVRRFAVAEEVLAANPVSDGAHWREIEKGFKDRPDSGLTQAYRGLLDPSEVPGAAGKRRARSSSMNRNCDTRSNFVSVEEAYQNLTGPLSDAPKDWFSSNEMFKRLTDRARVSRHADLLFKPNATVQRERFIDSVVEAGQAFGDARAATRDMWQIALDGLLYMSSPEFDDPVDSAVKGSLAKVIAELTSIEMLAVAMNFRDPMVAGALGNAVPGQEMKALLRRYDDGASFTLDYGRPSGPSALSRGLEDEQIRRGERNLAAALRARPRQVGKALRILDMDFGGAEESEIPLSRLPSAGCGAAGAGFSKLFHRFRTKQKRAYGLVRGPNFSSGEASARLQQVVGTLQLITAGGAEGLERGRLAEGIESLVGQYVSINDLRGGQDGDPQIEAARRRLYDTLVQFAKKVLVIANNEVLFSEEPRLTAVKPDLDRYTLVLQAVGNSIMVQANELSARAAHREQDYGRAEVEQEALRLALSRLDRGVIDAVLQDLEGQLEAARRDRTAAEQDKAAKEALKAAADQSVAALTAQQAAAVVDVGQKTTDLNMARDLLAGIAAALGFLRDRGAGGVPAAVLAPGQTDSAQLVDDIKTVLDNRRAGAVAGSTEEQALARAHGYLVPADFAHLVPAAAPADRQAVFDQVLAQVEQNEAQATELVALSTTALRESQDAKTSIDGQLATAVGAQAAALADVAAADSTLETRDATMTRLDAAIPEIRKKWLEIQSHVAGGSARVTFGLLVAEIRRALALAEAPGDDQPAKQETVDKLKAAVATLTAMNPPLESDALEGIPLKPGEQDSRAVLDKLIAILNHEHALAIRESGEQSARAGNIKASLEAAYAYRGNKVFIRPPSAYLRSSYPATSLQDNPGLVWSNRLGHHGLRTSPIFGFLYNRLDVDNQEADIVADIDKQFWQTINSVRVAGAGDSNYVIAKDDVGNWYVKSYSSNPESIIRSARSLALFGLGSQFNGTNLLERAEQLEDGTADGAAPAQTSQMAQVFTRHQERYRSQTDADFLVLQRLLATDGTSPLHQAILSQWAADGDTEVEDRLEELTEKLEAAEEMAFGLAQERLGEESDPTSEKAANMVDALTEVRLLHPRLEQNLTTVDFVMEPNEAFEASEAATETARGERDAKRQEVDEAETSLASLVDERMIAELRVREAEDDTRDARLRELAAAQSAENEQEERVQELRAELAELQTALDDASRQQGEAKAVLDSARRAKPDALALAAQVIRDALKQFAQRRLAALEDFETAIVFIGDANNPRREAASQ